MVITTIFILFTNQAQIKIKLGAKIERKIKTLQETKNTFENLRTDPKSVLFSEDEINNKLFKKF